jgi:hypothetical protein
LLILLILILLILILEMGWNQADSN